MKFNRIHKRIRKEDSIYLLQTDGTWHTLELEMREQFSFQLLLVAISNVKHFNHLRAVARYHT